MVFMLAPVAVAGYMHYKRRNAEREAQENLDQGQAEGENRSGDIELSSSHEHALSTASQKTTQTEEKYLGPLGKLKLFCANLEKEVHKAQERKRLECIQKAFDEAHSATSGGTQMKPSALPDAQAIPTLESATDTSSSEVGNMTEEYTLGQLDEQEEMVYSRAGNMGEAKNQIPESAILSDDMSDDRLRSSTD